MPTLPDCDHTCLFLDIDGTLLDIAFRPDDVVVPDALIRTLKQIDHVFGGAIALVSGRPVADVDALFAPLVLRCAGVHGAEQRFDPQGPVFRDAGQVLPAGIEVALVSIAGRFPGVVVENKHYAFAVHYRAAPAVRENLLAALRLYVDEHDDLTLLPGHFVFEIKRPTDNKGKAVLRFLDQKPFAGRTPIFIGDDTTDLFGFSAAVAHHGEAYAVGHDMPGATGSFAAPADVRNWLAELAKSSLVLS